MGGQVLDKYNEILIKKTEAEKFFEVSQSQLSKWIRQGGLENVRGCVNLYDLFIFWKMNIHGVEQIAPHQTDDGDKPLAELKRKIQAEILLEKQISNKKEKGKLIEKEQVLEGWLNRVSDLRTGLLSLKSRISHKAANKNEIEVTKVVEKEVDDIFNNFSREGKFCNISVEK